MLTDYYLGMTAFEHEKSRCDRTLAKITEIDQINRHQLGALGTDILGLKEVFIERHIVATAWVVEQEREVNAPENLNDPVRMITRMRSLSSTTANQEETEAKIALMALYKAFFFFIRAHHDALARAILDVKGHQLGRYTSMSKSISKEGNPVRAFVDEIDGYVGWLPTFKTVRDQLKEGRRVGLCGPSSNVGFCIHKSTREGGIVSDGRDCFRLSDLIEAINFSTLLLKAVTDQAEESFPH